MISPNLKALVAKMDDTCRRALEGAAGLCLSRSNYNVELEHWMVKLIEMPGTDLSLLFKYYDVDVAVLLRDLTKAIDRLKTGNARSPVLAPATVHLAREAFVVASLE